MKMKMFTIIKIQHRGHILSVLFSFSSQRKRFSIAMITSYSELRVRVTEQRNEMIDPSMVTTEDDK